VLCKQLILFSGRTDDNADSPCCPYLYSGIPLWWPIFSVHGLCKALAGLGHDVHVFTINVDGDRDSDVPLDGIGAKLLLLTCY
jgi:hypothetical protein